MTRDDQAMLAMLDAKMAVSSIAAMMGRSPRWTQARLDQLTAARTQAGQPPMEPQAAARVVEAMGLARASMSAVAVAEWAFSPACQPAPETSTEPAFVNKPPPTAYQGVTPAKLRFCRWFLDAGWRLATTAWLFDLEPEDLAEAL